ncbi:MAG: hypothetical protein NPINA01_08050 [Nitrospinaceae bacterium]|nr:MAG: hypothetical protein NPINA01_08050 [Nitrospinaceae bacterium]
MKSILIGTLSLLFHLSLFSPGNAEQKELAFKKLAIWFEVNETDGDGEVVFSVKAPEGLMWFKVFAPDSEVIIFINSNDERRGIDPIGLSQIKLETGEPSIDGVKKAYPEGTYKFLARTVSGDRVYGEAELSHKRLPAPDFSPRDEKGIDPNQAVVKWKPVKGAASYEVEIENDDLEVGLTAELSGSATRFNIPEGFLLPGKEYEIGVMTITKAGNKSVAESSFETAGK